ncbi:MAG: phosphoribosylaminoimidazolesuccinocarboxamide synthase [Patescibacteria group bacterium]|nr:phosphoribosylaminoimidazolesuccinocarboxamide synthase [Patescibacteria group bacterium]
MEKPEKGKTLVEGKTKMIFAMVGNDDLVIVGNKKDITAMDDPGLTRKFDSKAVSATTTTCNVFELLNACGIPTAYCGRHSETEFIMKKSKMVPLEVVARRRAVGSYLSRHPDLKTADKTKPKRFHRLEIEFFLKTTKGKFGDVFSNLKERDKEGEFSDKSEIIDDPLIIDARAEKWQLVHSKKPGWTKESTISVSEIPRQVTPEQIDKLEEITRRTFLVLEKAWAVLGLDLIDFKIEFDDQMRVSDVVDNDSWRLWKNGEQFDKQVFRDFGEKKLEIIERNYQFIAEMSARLTLPRQALVFWRGSESDPIPKEIPAVPGVDNLDIIKSGHKSTVDSLLMLDRIVANYPQGGVIVCSVGRSDGLGPILAAHTAWQVIICPVKFEEFPDDIWSSIRLASGVPLLTTWPESNAFAAAIGILAQTNPAAYLQLQSKIEKFDNFVA